MQPLLIFILILSLASCSNAPSVNNFPLSKHNKIEKIQILSSKLLKFPTYKGFNFSGISDLAWGKNKRILYALTDRAVLFHLKLNFAGDAINTVSVLDAYALKDQQGKRLKAWEVDSEGLDLHYNQHQQAILTVAFERHPRIVQYSTTGDWLAEVPLPTPLRDISHYRHPNKSLESVVFSPKYGLLTASEFPLKSQSEKQQKLYSTSGREWSFTASSAKKSAITALEQLPNQNILVLERAWAGIMHPLVINLSEIDIKNCAKGKICTSKNLAQLSTSDGWQLDNFEGLTQLKNNQYLMISDDNAKPIQNTILVLFKVIN